MASVNCARSISRALEALERACAGLDAEILVVDASSDETTTAIRKLPSASKVHVLPFGTLTPRLWAAGYALSRGRVVAFTTGHCVVNDVWARALLWEIEQGATGAAGPLRLGRGGRTGVVDWAVFYLRYSAFLCAPDAATETVREIPADNAVYRRDALARHAASFAAGFWEVDFHRRLRSEQGSPRLSLVPAAEARFGPSSSFATLARQRFAHGIHSGAWRVRTAARSAWQVVTAAPVVPFVLAFRIAKRVLRMPGERLRFIAALPVLLALAAAWAAGEAWGAVNHTTMLRHREAEMAA